MKNSKMKAVISTAYGGPEVFELQQVEIPIPKENEVRVKIFALPVTRAGTMMRTGYPLIGRLFMGLTKPKHAIAGTGFSGVVDVVGEHVKLFKKGDKVFGESLFSFGTYAEFVCIDEEGIIAIIPNNVSYEQAAVVGDGPITSFNFLKSLANIQSGQRVLINGASGSLGTSAIQLAKHFGAKVTGVCSHKNIEMVKALGADEVIDYTKNDFTNNGQTYDIIYDTVGKLSFSKCKKSLTKKGAYVSPVLGLGLLFQVIRTSMTRGKKAMFSATGALPVPTIRGFLQKIRALMEAGKLEAIIDRCYSLEEIAEAHRYIDKGHKRGNVVIVNEN